MLYQAVFRMNDKEKVEAVRKTLSLKIQGLMTYSRYVGLIHDIMDSKMTMTEVDDYVKDNFELDSSKSDS
jgi:type IV secretory pathway VirD2 relaxase